MMRIRKGLILLVAIGSIAFLLAGAGEYLVVDQPPASADVIVVFSGDRGSRMEKAAELFRQGYAPKVLISGGEVYDGLIISRIMKEHGIRLGIPDNAILLEEEADSTFQNAAYTAAILEKHQMDQVLVVTSDFHTRRTQWALKHEYAPVGIHYLIIAADDPEFNPSHWWSNNKSAMNTMKEYIKLAGYLAGREN